MFAASKTDSASTGGYQISRSLRFNSADSAYLNRTPASASNRTTWTYSAWVKLSSASTRVTLLEQSVANTDAGYLLISILTDASSNNFVIEGYNTVFRRTTASYRDFSAWYHIVVAVDTTQATANNRIRLYINGVEVTAFGTTNNPTQNADTGVNSTGAAYLGRTVANSAYSNAYMTEVNLIDGQALTPSSFGETNAQTGVWQPKAYSGTYGTNGFYLNFSDNSNTTAATLGKDYSGNGNNWTPNNFSVTAGAGNDSLVDSPTSYGTDTGVGGTVRGNYATLNPINLQPSNNTLSNGNLDSSMNVSGQWGSGISTIAVSSGKWYAEFTMNTISGSPSYGVGISTTAYQNLGTDGGGYYGRYWYYTYGYAYLANGSKFNNNASTAYGATYGTGDVIGVALDMDVGTVVFYKNGSSQGTAFTGLSGSFTINCSAYDQNSRVEANYGQRPFAYTAPSGYKALCTQNLPTPTIGATTATQAGKYFNPVLYTGTGASLSVTGVGFQPDWVWVKGRSGATDHGLYDAVRGVQKQLESNNTDAETTETTGITAFGSDGFTTGALAQLNTSAATYVAWNWKANGAGVSNTSGTITSTVSASTTSGFSIVTFTADGTTKTVGHGLGVAPKLYFVKQRNITGGPWYAFTTVIDGSLDYLVLNASDAASNSSYTAPTSTVIEYNDDASTTQVAYCFAEVAGYSKFGSYTGNGSADGPFVYCGFRPAFIMRKNTTNSLSGDNWYIQDVRRSPYNVTATVLAANQSYDEATFGPTNYGIDVLSNGFKIRDNTTYTNSSGSVYIYAAFAEVPTKFSLAR